MFSPGFWPNGPPHHHHHPQSSYAFQAHAHAHAAGYPNIPVYQDPHAYQAHRHHPPRRHSYKAHPKIFTIDTSDTNSSGPDFDLTTDTDSTVRPPPHTPYHVNRTPKPGFDLEAQFKRFHLRMPKRMAHELNAHDEVLILPPNLTHLKFSVYALHTTHAVRAAVAGDMRLRDVVRQILSQENLHGVRVYVKVRGEWTEASTAVKMSDLELGGMAGGREVGVRVIIGGGTKEKEREKGNVRGGMCGHGLGWERQLKKMESWRLH